MGWLVIMDARLLVFGVVTKGYFKLFLEIKDERILKS